jgi:lysyl-tRNA synthetase, class II
MSENNTHSDEYSVRLKKLENIKKAGINPYPASFDKQNSVIEIQNSDDGTKLKTAGRLMTIRDMGKLVFCHLQDESGKAQISLKSDEIDKEKFDFFLKNIDMGDFVGVEGEVFTTQKGEKTLLVKEYTVLSKTLLSLPDKWHGLKDSEIRYRKRYLDLIMNPEEMNKFKIRTKVISLVREYLDNLGFTEVETPILQVLYGGTNAKPFSTHINAYDMPMYLRVAPELYLKRLVVGGFEKVYEIAKNFRNEGVDQTHNPEFTMIEWYESYVDYNTMMDRTEGMYKFIAKKLFNKETIQLHDKKIDLSGKWSRMPLIDSIKKFADIDVNKLDDEELEKIVKDNQIEIAGESNRGQMIFAIFDKLVCDKLQDPIWIIDYPKEVSPLSKTHRSNPELVERFECYIGGKEIGDGWSEIINPVEQRNRFENEQAAMRAGDEEAHPMDEDFIQALEHGMPPLGGIGIGIDRLVMLFTNCWSIRDIMLFPIMKPKNGNIQEVKQEELNLGIDLKGAQELVDKHIVDNVTKLHLIESQAIMQGLAHHFKEDEEKWGILGLLHDIDWDLTKDDTKQHCIKAVEILKKAGVSEQAVNIIQAHCYGQGSDKFIGPEELKDKKRTQRVEHALAAAETLTGLIVASALMQPDKKLASVKLSSLKKKFKSKNFAANCNREIMKECEKIGLSIDEFLEIGLTSMQNVSDKLGL